MSGPLTVPFVFAGLYVQQAWQKILFGVMAVLCATCATYLVWKAERERAENLRTELDEVRATLKEIVDASPNVTLTSVEIASFPGHVVGELWFQNLPATLPSERSIAKAVTVDVELRGITDITYFLYFRAEWLVTQAETHVGFSGFETTRDILPNKVTEKLALFFQYRGEANAYAFCRDNWLEHKDWRHPDFAIPPGRYAVDVTLNGIGVSSRTLCELINPADGSDFCTIVIRR
jgi:hypothetical protein